MTGFQSNVDHPRTGHTDTLFAPVTLTLTRWPWSTTLRTKNEVSRSRISKVRSRTGWRDRQTRSNVLAPRICGMVKLNTHTTVAADLN